MPILPNASVKTKYDFTRSRFEFKKQFEIAPGANIVEEGTLLRAFAGPNGTEVVTPVNSDTIVPGTDRAVGISLQSRISATTFTDVRQVVVPAVPGPYTVQLPHSGLVPTTAPLIPEATAFDNNTGLPLALIAHVTPPAAPGPGNVDIDGATGLVLFDAAEAGHSVTLTYRWILSAIERDAILRQSHVNRGAEDQFGLMTVGYGDCLVYTSMYDCSQTYAVGNMLALGANGLFTLDGSPTSGSEFGIVVSVPTTSDPFLGVEYRSSIPGVA